MDRLRTPRVEVTPAVCCVGGHLSSPLRPIREPSRPLELSSVEPTQTTEERTEARDRKRRSFPTLHLPVASALGRLVLSGLAVALLSPTATALSQGIEPGWTFTSELNVVVSEGNSESLTLGLGAKAEHGWTTTSFRVEAKGVKTEASKKTRVAVGSAEDFEILESKVRETTAEAVNVTVRLDRTLGDGVFAFWGLDWLRNTFAGVDGRYLAALGAGSTLLDKEAIRLKVDLAGTYTFQNDVVENPFVKRNFPGIRTGVLFWKQISESTETESQLVSDWNVQKTEDLRLDWTNSLAVSVTRIVALKPSLQLQWRNQPSLTTVNLFDPEGGSTGETVTVPLEKLDMFFRVALVVTL